MNKIDLRERYAIERSKWDHYAAQARPIERRQLVDHDDFHSFAARQSILSYIAEFLGDVRGKKILECGCGDGHIATLFARSGAQVIAFDLSGASLEVAKQRAHLNGVQRDVLLQLAGAETLPYRSESFDIVFGRAILHHLELSLAIPEIRRVLKPGGKAAFLEPLGMNPLLELVRDHVWYPHKKGHGVDQPLTYEDIRRVGEGYRYATFREFRLLSMVERAFGYNVHFSILRRIDEVLLRVCPALKRYCQSVAITLRK